MTRTLLVVALCGSLGACQYASRALVEVPVAAVGSGERRFELDGGAALELDRASVTFSDLRLEEPPAADVASLLRFAPLGLWSAADAYAHPGHDYPGDVAGELLGTFEVDLLGAEQPLGLAPCYEGEYRTGRVHLAVARFAGRYIDPEGAVTPVDLEVVADQDIVGIPFDTALTADALPESIVLGFDVRAALQFTDWSVPDSDGDGEITLADPPYDNTILFGTIATPTWSLSIAP